MNTRLRIIDANANRAGEALRVLEDIARFALDSEPLTASLKDLRHDLREALAAAGLDRGLLAANRDTPGDVGTGITTEGEGRRTGLRGVALAAASRLTEAVRSIEECVKAGGWGARAFEAIRYRAYTAEQGILIALGAGGCPQWSLCVLITESLCTHHPWRRVAELAIGGGADCLQLREKELRDRELLARARDLVALARERGAGDGGRPRVSVVINDRPDIAVLARADALHLGQEDMPIADARAIAGFEIWIGVSTANVEQARRAIASGADYLGVGPMFPTTTKRKAELSGPAYLRDYLADQALAARPHLAIGGINRDNITEVRAAGGLGVAVSSAVCSAEDPAAVCAEIRRAMA